MDPILNVIFFKTASGNDPVRTWLRSLSEIDRKRIGEDLKTVQFGWPLGMPLVRKLSKGLWEVRVDLGGRISRIIFTVEGGVMVLLHGFIKKSQEIPKDDIELARSRLKQLRNES
jgi:phage-related protein